MYEYNEHGDDTIKNNKNSSKIEKKFLDLLYEFIHSVEFEMDLVLPGSASFLFLSNYKIIDHVVSQKLSKNIVVKMLCPVDEGNGKLIKQLVPFIGYKSIKPTLPKASINSLFFIRDKQDILSFSIDLQEEQPRNHNSRNKRENSSTDYDTFISVDDWSYSKDVSIVKNIVYCFETIWKEKENYDKIIKEKKHSELLFDVISHDIGNYHQILRGSLEMVNSLFEKSIYKNKNNNNNHNTNRKNSLSQNNEKIFSCLAIAKNALTKSQSLVDNIRRLERLYAQKENLKLILKNVPDAINNAYSTLEQALSENNPNSKRMRFSLKISTNMVQGQHNPADINIVAEDLFEEIFINLFSNSVKYTDSLEVKIDVLIKDYFIGESKYWMITISDYGKGIPDSMKKELFERFYSKAKGSGLGLSIVRTLVERYKGKIWVGDRVYEDYTKGTTVGMIFPAA